MKKIKIIISFLILIAISGCNNHIQQETLEGMITSAKSKVNTVSVVNYKAISDHDGSYEIIDCRQADDFIKGHIPGAVNIPRGILEFSDEISDRRTKTFIYNYDDGCSALCAESLLKLKYHDVSMIENGWKGWSETYPEIFETGEGKLDNDSSPKQEETGGGCGG